MQKTLAALALLCALITCGCAGSHRQPSSQAPVTSRPHPSGAQARPQTCHPRTPPAMGECVALLQRPMLHLAPTVRRPLGIDTSRWNGPAPNLTGVRFQIIQANYGLHAEPDAAAQMARARAHHVPFGCYTFLEPGVSGYQQARLANQVCSLARGRRLGLWADAEVPGVYGHVGTYVDEAARLGAGIVGTYSAAGLYQGGWHKGWLWVAAWGGPPAPFGGYPASAVVIHQFCGTCATDLDEALGILRLGRR